MYFLSPTQSKLFLRFFVRSIHHHHISILFPSPFLFFFSSADVVILNNVFEFFASLPEQQR